jgi:hypothetical protein
VPTVLNTSATPDEHRFDLSGDAVGLLQPRTDRQLDPDHEHSLVGRRLERGADERHNPETAQEQRRADAGHGRAVAERPHEHAPVAALQRVERPLEPAALARLVGGRIHAAEEVRREHRRERERLDQRQQHRDRDRDAEVAQEHPDDAAGERDRQEDRHDRRADRDDRQGDLGRAALRGDLRLLAVLHVAEDVLADHDRVVDQHPDR